MDDHTRSRPAESAHSDDRPLKPTLDDLGKASFPASDPPPSWTWEPAAGAAPER